MFLTCPRRYEYHYLKKHRSPGKATFFVGSLAETALDYHNQQRIEGKSGLAPHEVADYLESQYNVVLAKDNYDLSGWSKNKLFNEAYDCALVYVRDIAPLYVPTKVQHEFSFTIPNDEYGYEVFGIMDVITAGHYIGEHKTSRPSWWTPNRVARGLQPTVYQYAYEREFAIRPRVVYYIAEKETKTHQVLEAIRTTQDTEWLLGAFRDAIKAIELGVFPPTHPDDRECRNDRCSNYGECKLGEIYIPKHIDLKPITSTPLEGNLMDAHEKGNS
jgi:hypothetical protein